MPSHGHMEGASFSSDGVEVLSRKVQCVSAPEKEAKAERELSRYYEIERCTEFVTSNSFHRVGKGSPGNTAADIIFGSGRIYSALPSSRDPVLWTVF